MGGDCVFRYLANWLEGIPTLLGVRLFPRSLWKCRFFLLRTKTRDRAPRPLIRAAVGLGLTIALLIPYTSHGAQDAKADEYRAKASPLMAFPKFVAWPENAFPSAQEPLWQCVYGGYSFGDLVGRVDKWELNLAAAGVAHLKIGANMLVLARHVVAVADSKAITGNCFEAPTS